jgi:hypothetical protein
MLFSTRPDVAPQDRAKESSWIDEMREHYHATGEVRSEDMIRLLGDPSKGVYMQQSEQVDEAGSHRPLIIFSCPRSPIT